MRGSVFLWQQHSHAEPPSAGQPPTKKSRPAEREGREAREERGSARAERSAEVELLCWRACRCRLPPPARVVAWRRREEPKEDSRGEGGPRGCHWPVESTRGRRGRVGQSTLPRPSAPLLPTSLGDVGRVWRWVDCVRAVEFARWPKAKKKGELYRSEQDAKQRRTAVGSRRWHPTHRTR